MLCAEFRRREQQNIEFENLFSNLLLTLFKTVADPFDTYRLRLSSGNADQRVEWCWLTQGPNRPPEIEWWRTDLSMTKNPWSRKIMLNSACFRRFTAD